MDSENDDLTDHLSYLTSLVSIIEGSNSEEGVTHRRGERLVRDSRQLNQQVTIGTLPDDVLLNIFKFFVDEMYRYYSESEEWRTLVHVCQRWRNLVFTFPCHLNLQLCGAPYRSVKNMLEIWPELPIYIRAIDCPRKEAKENVAVALGLNDRVSGIRLEMTTDSAWEIFAPLLQHPFPALTHLWVQPCLSSKNEISRSFLGGSAPSLRDLVLIGVQFPALPELLLSAANLVRLWYDVIPRPGSMCPQEMITGLSALTRLESLSLIFRRPQFLPDTAIRIPPPRTRTLLPSLTHLCFWSVSEYMEDIMAQFDVPFLESMEIRLFHREFLEVSQLAKFIRRADKLSLVDRAEVTLWPDCISVTFSQELLVGKVDPKTLVLCVACHEWDFRLSYLAQFCASCLPNPSLFESLHILISQHYMWRDVIDDPDAQWLELLHRFNAVKDLRLSEAGAYHVAQTLRGLPPQLITGVLPALQIVFISGIGPSGPDNDAIFEFANTRRLSGHPVTIYHWEGEVNNRGYP